ncbi:MAG: carboxypeptidase regulatory-like domain-containing protein [Planctomyces sp.]|nr:carboxypeptidase regulatory-like domain-containing protein [Planctomyces sp.]
MVRKSFTRRLLPAFIASLPLTILPMAASADGPKPLPTAEVRTLDVGLQPDGMMVAQLVDQNGNGLSDVPVAIRFEGRTVAESKTDSEGRVRFSGLRPGVHSLHAGNAVQAVRLWQSETAPPGALSTVALVSDEEIVRGQMTYGGGYVPMNSQPSGFSGPSISPLTLGMIGFGVFQFIQIEQLEDDVDALSQPSST